MTPDSGNGAIDMSRVLWRTRGYSWGYTFVHRPTDPFMDGWYDLHVRVFEGVQPKDAPVLLCGTLDDGDVGRRFYAACLKDPIRTDAKGRTTGHYLIWFPKEQLAPPGDWPEQLLHALRDPLDAMFSMPAESDEDAEVADINIEERFGRAARALGSVNLLPGRKADHRDVGRVTAKKKSSRTDGAQRRPKVGWFILLMIVSVVVTVLLLFWTSSAPPKTTAPGPSTATPTDPGSHTAPNEAIQRSRK